MKKYLSLLLLCVLSFLLTGCVKFNATMDIKKDKSMDFSIIYAVDSSVFGEEDALDKDQKKELEKQGFTVSDYSEDKMKGFKISKKIKNIDEVSTEKDTEYSLSGIADSKENDSYIFKVKKGLLKNTYIAKLNFNTSDSGFSGNSSDDSSSWEWDGSDDSSITWDFDESDDTAYLEDDEDATDLDDMDLSSLTSGLDLSFNVKLPYAAKSSNATTKNDNNKSLTWNLTTSGEEAIEFEFELYNLTTIYMGVGGIALIIIATVIVFVFVFGKKKGSSNNTGDSSQVSQVSETQSVPTNFEQPTHSSFEHPVESVAQEPTQSSFEQPVENVSQEPVQQSFEQPVENVAQKPVQPSFEQPVENVAQEPVQPSFEQPLDTNENQSQDNQSTEVL